VDALVPVLGSGFSSLQASVVQHEYAGVDILLKFSINTRRVAASSRVPQIHERACL
jgi:hypothetical protein